MIILFEEFMSSTERVSQKEMWDKVESFCPGYDPKNTMTPPIYRGATDRGAAYMKDPRGIRRNITGSNNRFYNTIMASHTQFNPRSTALIGSFDRKVARQYAADGFDDDGNEIKNKLYIMIPAKGTVVNICPRKDIYECFPKFCSKIGFGNSVADVSWLMQLFLQLLTDDDNPVEPHDAEGWRVVLDKVEILFKEKGIEQPFVEVFGKVPIIPGSNAAARTRKMLDAASNSPSLYDFVREELSPSKNGFKQFKYGEEEPGTWNMDQEVWINAPGLLVSLAVCKKKYGPEPFDN